MTQATECTRDIEVEIPAGEVERETTRIAQSIQKRARIPGFRPGKAPLVLVQKHFSDRIREEMLETLVPAHLRSAFERESLEPVSTPTLDELHYEPGSPLTFKARFEVLPAIELGEYRSIRVAMAPAEVGPGDVEAAVESLRQRHSRREPSEATEATDGLMAVVEAQRLAEDASLPAETAQELAIEVGGEVTLPEFTAALRGMKPGEERELEVQYRPDYPSPSLAGQTRKYRLKLLRLERNVLPELSDEFVKEQAGAETVAELRERIESHLRAERAHEARHQAEEAVIEQLLGPTSFPVPQALVERQVRRRLERDIYGLAEQGIDTRKLNLDWGKLGARHEDAARREVRAMLALDKVAERENIQATPEQVEAEVTRAAAEMRVSAEEARRRLTENGGLDRMQSRLRQELVLDFLLSLATAKEPATS